jgi:hypothetical protein
MERGWNQQILMLENGRFNHSYLKELSIYLYNQRPPYNKYIAEFLSIFSVYYNYTSVFSDLFCQTGNKLKEKSRELNRNSSRNKNETMFDSGYENCPEFGVLGGICLLIYFRFVRHIVENVVVP